MCSAQNTPGTRCPCLSQHCLTSALGTSAVSAAGAALPAWKERGAVCSSQQESHVSPQGECWYVPLGTPGCPQPGFTAPEQLCPSVPARGGRDNPVGENSAELLLLTPTPDSPGSLSRQGKAARGAAGRAGLRQGCASPVQVRHLVPARLRESRERPGMCREREPEQREGPSLCSHQHQGWARLSHQSWEATA